MLKTCIQCQQIKPLPSFVESKLQPDGCCGWCQDCQKQYGLADFDNAGQSAKKKKSCMRCGFLFKASLKHFSLNTPRKDCRLSTRCKQCRDIVKRKIMQKKAKAHLTRIEKQKLYVEKHKKAYDAVGRRY